MLFEVLMATVVIGLGSLFIALPGYKLFRTLLPPKRNPLEEAKERLEQARLEAEAARLNKETEKLYDHMYEEVNEETDEEEKYRRRM